MHAEVYILVNPMGPTSATLVSRAKAAIANAFSMPALAPSFA